MSTRSESIQDSKFASHTVFIALHVSFHWRGIKVVTWMPGGIPRGRSLSIDAGSVGDSCVVDTAPGIHEILDFFLDPSVMSEDIDFPCGEMKVFRRYCYMRDLHGSLTRASGKVVLGWPHEHVLTLT